MRFAVIDAGGSIKWWGVCGDDELGAQAAHGATAVDISGVGAWTGRGDDYYFDSSSATVSARQAMAASVPATAAVGSATTLTLPPGAALSIDGAAVGTVDGSGSFPLTFSDAGTYAVAAVLWPYLDFSAEVVAS